MNANDHQPVLDSCSILDKSYERDYTDQLLILNPSSLIEEYRHGEYQYFFAKAGFGCDPTKLGTKVFGEFLFDGEKAAFRRSDFMGIADPAKLPEWAKEKLQNLAGQQSGTQNSQGLSM